MRHYASLIACSVVTFIAGTVDAAEEDKNPVPYDVYAIGACDVDRIEDLSLVRQLGFNCVEVFYSAVTPEYLAEANRLGIKVIPFLFPGDTANKVNSAAIDQLNLEQHRGNAAISAWFPIDEPSGGRVPAELCRETYEMIKARDPKRAIFTILNYSRETSQFKGTYDILGLDPYPIVYGGEWGGRLAMVANDIEVARQHDSTNPIWMVIQSFGHIDGWERIPTANEMVTMAGLGFVHGSEGTLYYPWHNKGQSYHAMNTFPETLAAVERFNRALAEAAPALADPQLDQQIRHDPAHVRLLVDKERQAYLFVVNGDYGKRTITIRSDLFRNATLVGAGPTIALSDNRIEMRFEDCGLLFAKMQLSAAPAAELELNVSSDPPQPRLLPLNQIANVVAAELDPGGTYGIGSVGDDSFITNWASPRPYTLPFPVDVTFREARPVRRVTIHPLIIDNSGYDAWKDVRLTTSDGQVLEAVFGKKELPYIFDLSGKPLTSLKIEVLTTHDHRNYLGIREIEVE